MTTSTTWSRIVRAAIFIKPVPKFIPTENLNTTRLESLITHIGRRDTCAVCLQNLPQKRYPYSLSAKNCCVEAILSRDLSAK